MSEEDVKSTVRRTYEEPIVRRTYDAQYANFQITSHVDGATLALDKVERLYIQHVLQITGGNKTLAAKLLDIDRRTLYRKLRKIVAPGETRGKV